MNLFPEHIARPSDMEFSKGLLHTTEHNFGYSPDKNCRKIVRIFFEITCPQIFFISEKSTSKSPIDRIPGRKITKNIEKSILEARELIFTMQIIFQTCSEFDGKVFWKNRFLKKSFLKVLTIQNFVIFCSFLVTKKEQKITKCGLVRTFKNDFFKNLFFQKTFPSNSEQV